MARLNSRLSPRLPQGEIGAEREWLRDSDQELEARLLNQYLQLGVDDLQQVSPRVHEWLLDRMSQGRTTLNADDLGTLTALYFLFPESTVRHSVVGLMVQADSHRAFATSAGRTSPSPRFGTRSIRMKGSPLKIEWNSFGYLRK